MVQKYGSKKPGKIERRQLFRYHRRRSRNERHFNMIKEIMPTRFNCKRCGTCCKSIGIPWTELDPGAAADYLGIRLSDFMKAYGFVRNEYSGHIEPTEYNAAPCPFLRYDKKHATCEIYPVRPCICKGYPGAGTSCIKGQRRS
jgi:Fe-S-cluster containining protein